MRNRRREGKGGCRKSPANRSRCGESRPSSPAGDFYRRPGSRQRASCIRSSAVLVGDRRFVVGSLEREIAQYAVIARQRGAVLDVIRCEIAAQIALDLPRQRGELRVILKQRRRGAADRIKVTR